MLQHASCIIMLASVTQAAGRRKQRLAFTKSKVNGSVREPDVVAALRGALSFYEGLQVLPPAVVQ